MEPTAYVPTPIDRARSFAARWSGADLPSTPTADLAMCITTLESHHAACDQRLSKLPGLTLLGRMRAEVARRAAVRAAANPVTRVRRQPDGAYSQQVRGVTQSYRPALYSEYR